MTIRWVSATYQLGVSRIYTLHRATSMTSSQAALTQAAAAEGECEAEREVEAEVEAELEAEAEAEVWA